MWCVLVSDANQMAGDAVTVGPYRSREKASEVAEAINRKIQLRALYYAEQWDMEGGEPQAWVREMRVNRTEVYDDLGVSVPIRSLL